jgi:lipopolysaccharide biosynthesis protein
MVAAEPVAETQRPRLVALYFPQLHRVPENDAWWGDGFTDWDNVRRARPLFAGHAQPRVPLGGHHYDQSQPEVIRRQVELARRYGIGGFCHYHYWFDGKQLLETPTNLFLEDRALRMPFCLAWANESWSRRWDGRDHVVLQRQTHPPTKESWERHFRYLVRAFTDERALRIDGRPLFLIRHPERIEALPQMLDYFRERAHAHGLAGLYFVALNQEDIPAEVISRHFDAQALFQPFSAYFQLRPRERQLVQLVRGALPEAVANFVQRRYEAVRGHTLIDYEEVWQQIARGPHDAGPVTFPGAFVDWDNTARYGKRALVMRGASPARFGAWLTELCARLADRPVDERLIFVNAWNEWAEGAYLEPDEQHGHGYLEAIARVMGRPA